MRMDAACGETVDAPLSCLLPGLQAPLDPLAFDFDVAELNFNVDAPGGIS